MKTQKIPSVTVEQFRKMDTGAIQIVDIRDETAFGLGHIPGAVRIPLETLKSGGGGLDRTKPVLVYCMRGVFSADAAAALCKQGYDACQIEGGFRRWLAAQVSADAEQKDQRRRQIDASLQKKFHRELFSRFAKAVARYELVNSGDKIAVCISGGKDSMLMAKLFQELKRHNKVPFELIFLLMDPGYSTENRKIIESNAALLGIPLTIFETQIFSAVDHVEKNPCYLCARMRRGYLYKKAQELGCNKIALGHHYDDVIETILMGMLYGGQTQTMMPKLRSTNYEGLELIRPLYFVREDDIKHWRDYNGLHFIQCACHFTDTCTTCHTDGTTSSKRLEIKKLIAELKKTNPQVEQNIFASMENVCLDTVLAYKRRGVQHSFLEWYGKDGTQGELPTFTKMT